MPAGSGNEISLIDVMGSDEEDISLRVENESEQKALLELGESHTT